MFANLGYFWPWWSRDRDSFSVADLRVKYTRPPYSKSRVMYVALSLRSSCCQNCSARVLVSKCGLWAFGELYSRKGILYGVVASVLRKHPAFSARVERLRTAPWNWQSWRVPWYFWQNSSSSDVGGIEQHDMTALQKSWKESNLWCCATLVHFWFKIRWHPT